MVGGGGVFSLFKIIIFTCLGNESESFSME